MSVVVLWLWEKAADYCHSSDQPLTSEQLVMIDENFYLLPPHQAEVVVSWTKMKKNW